MKKFISIFTVLQIILTAFNIAYADYYVATNGSDTNPGTLAQPWRTVQKAADTAGPGTTVYVREGVYNEQVTINVSGTEAGGHIIFRNYEGETPVLNGEGFTEGTAFLIEDQSRIILQGFEILNYQTVTPNAVPMGIHVRGASHHIEIRDNRVHDIRTNAPADGEQMGADAHGIAVYGTSAESVHHIVIHGNELYDLTLGSSEALVLNGNVETFTVSNNVIRDCDNIGIDLIGFEGVSPDPSSDQVRNGIVVGNTVYNISSFGNPAYGEEYSAGGIYADGAGDIIVERNTVYFADIDLRDTILTLQVCAGMASSAVSIKTDVNGDRRTGLAEAVYTLMDIAGLIPDSYDDYEREDWPHWKDEDDDCQNTRAEILIRDNKGMIEFKDGKSCEVLRGEWICPYTGNTFTEASDIHIDHIVPLKNAHEAGGSAWSEQKKEAFANDPLNLLAVEDNINGVKSDMDPNEWKPPLQEYWQTYAEKWRAVKKKYDLSVSDLEDGALEEMEE